MTKQLVQRLVGAGVGILIGILWLTIGFWKTLLLTVLAALGWLLSGMKGLPPQVYDFIARIRFPWDK